jgi:DNA-binding transcriptional MerR regulator
METPVRRYGISAFARLCGRSEATIRNLDQRGIIKADRDTGNRRVFSDRDLELVREYYEHRNQRATCP